MSLPEPYRSWFEIVVGRPPPDEPLATCEACPLCARGQLRPTVKCCGYAPALPNFRAGGALSAGGLAAEKVRERLTHGEPTPHFLLPTDRESAVYEAEGQLGASEAGRCPYMSDDHRCGIWAWRNATCATWFCLHRDGEAGARMWQAAAELFRFAEGGIAVWASGDGATEDDYSAAAERARSLDWEDIRRLGGAELRALEAELRQAAATAGLG